MARSDILDFPGTVIAMGLQLLLHEHLWTMTQNRTMMETPGGYRAPNDQAAEAAENYISTVDSLGDGEAKEWMAVRQAGDALLAVAGTVTKAAESLWQARERLGRNNLAGVLSYTPMYWPT